jgi:hypothetical protein
VKLRIAKKIAKAIGTAREFYYTEHQKNAALDKLERAKTARQYHSFWCNFMRGLGPAGRAKVVASWSTAEALGLLMRTPEDEWGGDAAAMERAMEIIRQ